MKNEPIAQILNQETEESTTEGMRDVEIETEGKRRRSRTLSRKMLAREHRKMRSHGELLQIVDSWHPTTRSDCYKMARPCLFVSCRHHLYLDVNPESGSVKLNFPDKEVWELEETCALDVAERGGITLEEIGSIMNLTRERIRQLELRGLAKLNNSQAGEDALETYAHWDPYEDLTESD